MRYLNLTPITVSTNFAILPASPTESDQDERAAVAYQDAAIQPAQIDRSSVAAMHTAPPKFKVSSIEIIPFNRSF